MTSHLSSDAGVQPAGMSPTSASRRTAGERPLHSPQPAIVALIHARNAETFV